MCVPKQISKPLRMKLVGPMPKASPWSRLVGCSPPKILGTLKEVHQCHESVLQSLKQVPHFLPHYPLRMSGNVSR